MRSAMRHNPPITPPTIGPVCDELVGEELSAAGICDALDVADEVAAAYTVVDLDGDIAEFPSTTAA